ncbi:TULIP family P47-like protein [Hymenobacter negativus]|uniref:TULIP family P47-like protein n=1 Tax=Hymenobacter negativus TaxID=2795026 RepID=A0ABS3QKT2_9BACT|nr:TULIP family P47-like protein [Hymenobacter negativus]MBO2011379.1 TULIP family P47-like protein [Hymenobacter negativus]
MSTTSTTSNPISTNGWDSVSALTYEAVNQAIVALKSSPPSFSISGGSEHSLAGPYTVSANFGDWQVTEGGDGQNVWMSLPLNNGVATFPSSDNTYHFSGTAIIEVKMNYIPQPGSPTGTGTGDSKLLQILTQSTDNNVPIVSIEELTLDQKHMDSTVVATIQGALLEWLQDNLQVFNHVFAVADLNVVLSDDEAGFQWLKPTYVSYAVVDNASLKTSIFGVLAMTRNIAQYPAPTSHQISPDAIPSGCNGGFLVSEERFLTEMLLPGVYLLFYNASPADFTVGNDNTSIVNTAPLFFNLTDDDDNNYNAKVDAQNFSISILGQQLSISFTNIVYESGLGVYTHIDYKGIYVLSSNSSHQLQMDLLYTPTLRTSITLSEGRSWADIGITIAASIAGAVIGAVLGGIVDAAVTAGAEAATDTMTTAIVDGAGDALADGGTEVAADASLDEVVQVAALNAPEVLAEDAAVAAPEVANELAGDGGKTAAKGFLRRMGPKMLGSMIGGAIGAGIGSIPLILTNIGADPTDIPSLDEFAEQAISPITWPNTSGYEMVSAGLNQSMQIGINFTAGTPS